MLHEGLLASSIFLLDIIRGRQSQPLSLSPLKGRGSGGRLWYTYKTVPHTLAYTILSTPPASLRLFPLIQLVSAAPPFRSKEALSVQRGGGGGRGLRQIVKRALEASATCCMYEQDTRSFLPAMKNCFSYARPFWDRSYVLVNGL